MADDYALLNDETRAMLREEFKKLREPVIVEIHTRKGHRDTYNEFSISLLNELSALTDKLQVSVYDIADSPRSAEQGIEASPTILVAPDRYRIRFTGAPAGEEGRTLLMAVFMASTGEGRLAPESVEKLKALTESRQLRVFVSPSCPYCPPQAAQAIGAAVAHPGRISVEIVEIQQNRDLAERYGISSVPQTYVGETPVGMGFQPQDVFIESVIKAALVTEIRSEEPGETDERDLVIVGGGPAGLTAAIYGVRAGLSAIVLERANVGGQVAITPTVENYPGFSKIAGRALVEMMYNQAREYCPVLEGEGVTEISRADDGRFKVRTSRRTVLAGAVLIAAGADHRKLGIPSEDVFQGKGVSYCATCDGFFYKDGGRVLVVGGGNSAVTDAIYLKGLNADVTLVHRRDTLRAQEHLRKRVEEMKIPVLYETEIEEVLGGQAVTGARLKNRRTGEVKTVETSGVFVAIGYDPVNNLARAMGCDLDEDGYVVVDDGYRTSVPGVYAAGDLTGGLKQIVTAVSQGATAAMTAFEDLKSPYWTTLGGDRAKT